MEDRPWRLGEDLRTCDSLLDGVTFDDLILAIHSGVKKEDLTPDAVRYELRKHILEARLEDMWFLVDKNMDKIIESVRNYYCDE